MHSRKSIFSKDPIINLENFQKQKSTLGFLRFNSFDFKIDYKTVGPDIQTKKNNGFNVGLVDLRLHEYINRVLNPVLCEKRDLYYPIYIYC
jgi:hypothetical protein